MFRTANISISSRSPVATIFKLLLVALVTRVCVTNPDKCQELAIGDAGPAASLTKPLHELGGKLLLALNDENNQTNIVFSPISIHQALSMVLLGSDRGTRTRRELLNAIGYSNMSEIQIEQCHKSYMSLMTEFKTITNAKQNWKSCEPPKLDMFTMMVTKNEASVLQNYEREIGQYFNASISSIQDRDPADKRNLINKLNGWGEEVGFDKPLLEQSDLDDNFEALLITAIQVEAYWWREFEVLTGEKIFYNFGFEDKPVNGKYLYGRKGFGSYIKFTAGERGPEGPLADSMRKDETIKQLLGLDFNALKLVLKGDLTFTIFQPLADGSESSEAKLPNEKLNRLIKDLFSEYKTGPGHQSNSTKLQEVLNLLDDQSPGTGVLRMPKFKFESDIDLIKCLRSLGIERAFSSMLSEISNVTKDSLHISKIKHKAFIKATKKGLKAAGFTNVSGYKKYINAGTDFDVTIDRPFLFVLRYKSTPLFIGRLTNLTGEKFKPRPPYRRLISEDD